MVKLLGQSSDPDLRDPYLGSLLGQRYQVTQLLGTGAMGRVYLAHDQQLGQVKVAIKVLTQSLQDPKARQRFEREAQTGAYLGQKSLHIVRVNDYGITPQGIPYSVMEYLSGLTLREMLEQSGCFDLERAVRLGRQIALGLQAAHEGIEIEGRRVTVIHRDLKPANVMVVADPSLGELAKILDFGIAKLQDPQGLASITHAYVGTLAYSSPEQLEGLPLDGRSDLYSFGVMLYQMLSGDLPLVPPTDSYPAWYQAHHKGRPLPIDELCDIPVELADLVMACLAKHPADRPQSAAQIVSYLQAIEAQLAYHGPMPPVLAQVGGTSFGEQRGGTVRLGYSGYTQLEPHPWGQRLLPLLLGSLLGLGCVMVGWTAMRAFFRANPPLPRPVTSGITNEIPPLTADPDPSDPVDSFARVMQAGQQAFEAGDFEEALRQFDLALSSAPIEQQETVRSWQQETQARIQALSQAATPEATEPDPDEMPLLSSDLDLSPSPELLGQIFETLTQAPSGSAGNGSPSEANGTTIALRTFPIRASRSTVRSALGQPQSSGTGYWPNTVYDLYNFESPRFVGRVDLGLIYDRDSLQLRQSEVTVADGVPDQVVRMLMGQLLQGDPPPAVTAGLGQVRQRQRNRFDFQYRGWQGVIERNPQGNVYMAVWEPDLHQAATTGSSSAPPRPNPTSGSTSQDLAPGETLQRIREQVRDRR